MKKIKLCALSLLALSTAGVLASCGNNKPNVPTKPDVYFRAKAALISPDGTVKNVDFENEECATITIKDKENLQYEKQDVEITIEPKNMFTFRKYDVATWEPISAPNKPYVGLGNPYNLYSVPLAEDLAWTFKDESEASEKTPGFYKEKYVITVKKEAFKKNIVIDYGNVYANPIYTYNSERYSYMFSDALTGQYKYIYELDPTRCNFASGSKGATVTYRFKEGNTLASFDGFEETEDPIEGKEEPRGYKHFVIKGLTKESTNAEPEYETLSLFDPKKKEQLFIPTVGGEKEKEPLLSFYFDWSLLANGEDKGYSEKYQRILVEIKEPTLSGLSSLNIEASSDIKVHLNNFYTYDKDDGNYFAPLSDDTVTGNAGTSAQPKYISFDQISVLQKTEGESTDLPVCYGILFETPEHVNAINCEFVGHTRVVADLSDPYSGYMTKWRIETYTADFGETELRYWVNDEAAIHQNPNEALREAQWILVQLNPQGRTINGVMPVEYQGKGNMFYLYSRQPEIFKSFSGANLSISCESIDVATIKLVGDNPTQYGGLGTTTSSEYAYPVDGEPVDLQVPFCPLEEYKYTDFNVELTSVSGGDVTNYKVSFHADPEYSFIKIENIKGESIVKDTVFEISLTPSTVLKVCIDTNVSPTVGLFYDDVKQTTMDKLELDPATVGSTLSCKFYVMDDIKRKINLDRMIIDVTYRGEPITDVVFVKNETNPEVYEGTININLSSGFNAGDCVYVKVRYAELCLDENSQQYGSIYDEVDAWSKRAYYSTRVGDVEFYEITIEFRYENEEPISGFVINCGTVRGTYFGQPTIEKRDDTAYVITIPLVYGILINGDIISIHLEPTA